MADEPGDGAAAALDTKRYDRQIRLWGLETQRGLQGANVLLLRASGLGNEIAKNLVLAGVGHLCVQDAEAVSEAYVAAGGVFSVSKVDIGKNRAAVAKERLQALNPQVRITAAEEEFGTRSADFLRGFQFIVATHGTGGIEEICACTALLRADDDEAPAAKRARRDGSSPDMAQPKLIAAGAMGMFGFAAFDLLEFTHTAAAKKGAPADPDAPDGLRRCSLSYPTIATAMSVEWHRLGPRSPRLYCALQLLLEHGRTGGSGPSVEERRVAKLAEAKVGETFLREPLDAAFVAAVSAGASSELAPVCAIMGGMVATEVIKIIGGKEAPINNVLLFDATASTDAAGVVARLG